MKERKLKPLETEKRIPLLNAFSLQMLDEFPCKLNIEDIDESEINDNIYSVIGHQDTANVLGVPMRRINIRLHKGDTAYVAQLVGGRLPEGCTTLPEGFSFKFFKIEIL